MVLISSQSLPQEKANPTPVRFVDVLEDSGIDFRHHFFPSEQGENYRMNQYDHGSGVLVADVNNDGRMDIYLLDFLGPNALYINKGNFKFEETARRAGVDLPEDVSVGGSFGDYDNDGDSDLYVTTYRTGNHLFRNRGDGTFEDVSKNAGVGHNGHSSAALWFDYDLDGNLDLPTRPMPAVESIFRSTTLWAIPRPTTAASQTYSSRTTVTAPSPMLPSSRASTQTSGTAMWLLVTTI
jgi:hypothetical protein